MNMQLSYIGVVSVVVLVVALVLNQAEALGEIIYAINCGGEAHIDIYGVKYQRDPLHGKAGTASDYGKQLIIGRVPQADQILYQTERYHFSSFGYDIPVKGDGNYVLVLKFSEVYFSAPNQRVFDVVLNGEHTVVADLDIFERVGKGVAHDDYIPFSINKGKIIYNDEESEVSGGKIKVEFIKGYRDNPKINAVMLMKGTMDDIPKLPPLPPRNEEQELESDMTKKVSKSRRASGPKTPDPYAGDETSTMLPVFVAIGAFIPLLFCLCKL